MYFFYMTPLAPFLVIGITLVLGDILGRGAARAPSRPPDPAAAAVVDRTPAPGGPGWSRPRTLPRHAVGIERRLTSVAVVAIYVGLVAANFIWLWPILMGDPITPARLVAETWLPSWG
jgi:dolichyl-phosphate-mannose--protein O-mannosyl transferase